MEEVKILVVDDNENNRYTLRRRLNRLGYKLITEAENGQLALNELAKEEQDIILLDVMMPVMDGFEVLTHIKNTPKYANIPVIMISALDDIENIVQAIELGADDYLPKPFNPTLLAARIKAASRKRRLIKIETNYYKDFDKDTDFAKLELFNGGLDNEMTRNLDANYSVIYIQLGHYNFICQSLNIDAANQYLKQQSRRLQRIFADDKVTYGRLSDDTIAIYALSKNLEIIKETQTLNDDLLLPLKQPLTIDKEEFEGNIGIGISMAQGRHKKTKSLISNAAFASQTAMDKETGVEFYDPALHQQNIDKFRLEPKLRQAIKNQELTMHYQPIVNAKTGDIESYEALIRWTTSSGEMISPFKFITLAEETGLIFDIDRYVIDQTCQQIARWIEKFGPAKHFTIGANISAKHWVNPDLVNQVKSALMKYQVPPHYLKLEMTESAMVDDANTVKMILTGLKGLGIKIALDDFGTGYSSLGYLLEFPVDILKIDKVFVDDIESDKKKLKLLSHILSISKSLGMTSIVEGVELEEQASLLQQLDCDQIQGFHFYKPMAIEALEDII